MNLQARSNRLDRAFAWSSIGAAMVVLLVLAAILGLTIAHAEPVFERMGLEFFTSKRWSPADKEFGALPFIWGSLFTAAIAVAFAVPVSLAIATLISQVARGRVRALLTMMLDLLAAIPSVVFGLWGVLVLAQPLGSVYMKLSHAVSGWPLLGSVFGASPQGRSFMTAGVILAIMIVPIIASVARDVMDTTPQSEKEGAYALGATRWEMVANVVWPHSRAGVTSAVMLGLGRALGETIAAALVIGSSLGQITINAFAPGNSMPAVIANEWGEADGLHRSALIGLAVVLFVMTVLVNFIANAIVKRRAR